MQQGYNSPVKLLDGTGLKQLPSQTHSTVTPSCPRRTTFGQQTETPVCNTNTARHKAGSGERHRAQRGATEGVAMNTWKKSNGEHHPSIRQGTKDKTLTANALVIVAQL